MESPRPPEDPALCCTHSMPGLNHPDATSPLRGECQRSNRPKGLRPPMFFSECAREAISKAQKRNNPALGAEYYSNFEVKLLIPSRVCAQGCVKTRFSLITL
jgi:hypothetical protein